MHRSITASDGIKIAYDIHGHGPAWIVLVHGVGGDHLAWAHERELFHRRGYSTLALDLRGHGLSGRPEDEAAYDLARFAIDLHEILEEEKINHFTLVGHSFGGAVVIMFHALFPDKATAYVLVDTTDKSPASLITLADHDWLHALINWLLAHQSSSGRHYLDVDIDQYAGSGDWYLPRIAQDIQHTGLASWLATYESLTQFDGRKVLKSINQPVLVLEGDQDTVLTPDIAIRIQHELPHAKLKFVPGQNHVLVISDPYDIADSIDQFIQALPKDRLSS